MARAKAKRQQNGERKGVNTKMMKRLGKAVAIGILFSTVVVLLINYFWISPWNIHSVECWMKVLVYLTIYVLNNLICVNAVAGKHLMNEENMVAYVPLFALPIVVIGLVIGALSGAQIFHASAYANLITVEEVESSGAILMEKDAKSIALMDTASARQLGDREIGSIKNFSAFDVSDEYVQLNVKGDAVKIAPLEYAGFFKWMKNKESGVTGYVTVSPTTMTADYVELEEGMQYVPSACFSKDLARHIHRAYPTKIFDNVHFEIDENGKPYYVASVYKKTIGLFGGEKVCGAIIVNPVDGECEYYDLEEIPSWVDYVVDGNLICEMYNNAFKNKNGYWNGTFLGANTGCTRTTTVDGKSDDDDEDTVTTDYGYIAKDEDVYIYTGITSMAKDSSNLGFILVNERTGDYRYFAVSGANEQSAMNAAEGEVQQYKYEASFPTLINVDNELTYIGVLKDSNGLVKMYYMVNVQDYGKVAVASSREECVEVYAKKLNLHASKELLDSMDKSPSSEEEEKKEDAQPEVDVTFTIAVLQYVSVDGNTYLYMGTEDGTVYKAKFADNEKLLFAKVGDTLHGKLVKDVFVLSE